LQEGLNQKMYIVDIPDVALIELEKNKSDLSILQQTTLNKLVDQLRKDTALLVEIAAHADLREAEGISGKRAKAVADFLKKQGVAAKQLIQKDYGKAKPVSKTERNKNSRVELTIYSVSKSALVRKINQKDPLRLQVAEGIFQKGENVFVDALPTWQTGTFTVEKNGRVAQVEIRKVEEPRPKTFDEARGQVVSDYQAELEKRWVERLRKQNPVVINEGEVSKLAGK
jgi:peptidyl-prolyl cis-trans isomerase SurA